MQETLAVISRENCTLNEQVVSLKATLAEKQQYISSELEKIRLDHLKKEDNLKEQVREVEKNKAELSKDKELFSLQKSTLVRNAVSDEISSMRNQMETKQGLQVEFLVEKLAREKQEIEDSCKQKIQTIESFHLKAKVGLEAEVSQLKSKLQGQEELLENLRSKYETTIKALEDQSKNQKEGVKTRIHNLQDELHIKEELLTSLRSKVDHLQDQADFLNSQISYKNGQLKNLMVQLESAQKLIKNQDDEHSKEIEEAKKRFMKVLEKRDVLVEDLKKELQKYKAQKES